MGRHMLLGGTLCAVILSVVASTPLPRRMQPMLELSREVTYSEHPDAVSPHILDFEGYPKWWRQLRSVERLAGDEHGRPTYRVVDIHGHAYVARVEVHERRWFSFSIRPESPKSRAWEYWFLALGGLHGPQGPCQANLSVQRRARTLAMRIPGTGACWIHLNPDSFLQALGSRLGEQVRPHTDRRPKVRL